MPGDRGLGAVAGAAVRAAAKSSGSIDRQGARALGEQLVSLVSLALGDLPAAPPSASRAMLLAAVLDAIERSLYDPELSLGRGRHGRDIEPVPAPFAVRAGRELRAAGAGPPPERSRRELVNPTYAHDTISQIAFAQGFADPSYFARAFKMRYGMTPTQARGLGNR